VGDDPAKGLKSGQDGVRKYVIALMKQRIGFQRGIESSTKLLWLEKSYQEQWRDSLEWKSPAQSGGKEEKKTRMPAKGRKNEWGPGCRYKFEIVNQYCSAP
jgi:hypothetical protein